MEDTQRLLVRLTQDTILESIFEVRYEASSIPLADLLPGLIFSHLREEFPELESLPISAIPREVARQDPNLIHQPTKRLKGEGKAILIGDRVVSITMQRPYPGWDAFKRAILRILEIVRQAGVVPAVERYSIKYVNLIPHRSDVSGFDLIVSKLKISEWNVNEHTANLRLEVIDSSFLVLLTLANKAAAQLPDGSQLEGLLADIDIIRDKPDDTFWAEPGDAIEAIHTFEKRIFLSLLTEETLAAAGPQWEA